jgi:hypothetical protein
MHGHGTDCRSFAGCEYRCFADPSVRINHSAVPGLLDYVQVLCVASNYMVSDRPAFRSW